MYSVTGTIGQPDAGTLSGGNYTLAGGFWSILAVVQTPGAPWLSLASSNGVVIYDNQKGTDDTGDLTTDVTTGQGGSVVVHKK